MGGGGLSIIEEELWMGGGYLQFIDERGPSTIE